MIKFYKLSEMEIWQQRIYAEKIYKFLFLLNFEYPDFKKWYDTLFEKDGRIRTERQILLCLYNDELAGVAILKKNNVEDKICTLRVSGKYRQIGLGRALLKESINYLQNERPLITVHIAKYHSFKKLFDYFGFSLEQEILCCYGALKSELSYNGTITPKKVIKPTIVAESLSNLEKLIYGYPERKIICSYPSLLIKT